MKKILVLGFILLSSYSFANEIKCSYNFENDVIKLNNVNNWPFIKKYERDNLFYKIYVKSKEFNEINDYLTIKNDKGHKMTYSLNCKDN